MAVARSQTCCDGVAVLAEHQDVSVEVVDLRIVEQHGADVVEGRDHRRAGQDLLRLLGRRAGGHRQREGPLLVEAERVDAVDDDLAGELGGQRPEQVGMALVGHGDDHQVGLGRRRVVRAADLADVGVRGGDVLGPFGGPAADDDR